MLKSIKTIENMLLLIKDIRSNLKWRLNEIFKIFFDVIINCNYD